jgi:outer membrane receptor protein involved in Fe transport
MGLVFDEESRLFPIRPPQPRHLLTVLLAALAVAPPAAAVAQLQVAVVHGRVIDSAAAPVSGAAVLLQDSSGNTVSSTSTADDGSFRMADVAPGTYGLRVEVGGSPVLSRTLVVRGSLPVELSLQTGVALSESIVVRGDAGSATVDHSWSIAGAAVREAAEPNPSGRVQATLASLAGWRMEDNGLLHVRGVDDGLLYVQDGIPVYARLDRLFGMPPNPSAIASLHVLNGYIPPEFGFKSGAVVEVRTETGIQGSWTGAFDTGIADLDTRHLEGFAAGPLGSRAGLMVTGSDERSSRFLDPVALENFHNEGRTSSVAAQLTYGTGGHLFTGSAQLGRARYEVPHTEAQELAGQDQHQRTTQMLVSGSWQRVLSARTVWQASAYRRQGSATLVASPADTPVTAGGRRLDERHGALASVTHQRERHTFKFGGELSALALHERFSFAVTHPEDADEAGLSEGALAHGPDDPFEFEDRRRPTLASLFAQDVFQASDRLTLNFGVRFDSSTQLVEETAWSPRVGAAWRAREGTTVRASWLRLFQPPQVEYLLLSSSAEARRLSPFVSEEIGGGTELPAERQSALELSLTHLIAPGLTMDGSLWRRRATDVDDPNVFFGTTVTFPNSVARQRAGGFDLRLAAAARGGFSGSLAYSHARIVQFGPVTGGLFIEDEVAEIQEGTRFTPDHDQRHALTAMGAYANERRRVRLSGAFRYQTGTPAGIETDEPGDLEELRDRPGSDTVDFETGRVKPRAVLDLRSEWTLAHGSRRNAVLSLWMNNVTDETYAFNFGNPFSGTHFGSRRRVGIALRVEFRQSRR